MKPANLFITSGHVKVGDYGLVCRLDRRSEGATPGLTPKYVAPEVLRGHVDARSDQYSLALVYQEMLTGTFPYAGRTAQQMMLAHVSAQPNLSTLPEHDRAAVAQALSKNPVDRFGSCQDFINELLLAAPSSRVSGSRSGVAPFRSRALETTPGPAERTSRHQSAGSGTKPNPHRDSAEVTRRMTNQPLPPLTTAGRAMPSLVPAGRWPSAPGSRQQSVSPPVEELPLAEPLPPQRVTVSPIRPIVPVARLHGEQVPNPAASAQDFAAAVFALAANGNTVPALPGDITRLADGSFICQFPSTVPESFIPLKLGVVRDQWSMSMDVSAPGRLVFSKAASGGMWSAFSGKKAGLELVVKLPPSGKSIGEVTIRGSVYGTPDRAFIAASHTAIPKIIEALRRELANVADRRRTPRIATDLQVKIHPLHSNGTVDPAVVGRCRDISTSGIALTVPAPIKARYAYLEFEGNTVAGLAILVKLLRSQPVTPAGEHLYAGPFRLEL